MENTITKQEGNKATQASMLDGALDYAVRGWAVFPIEQGGKKPLCKWREESNRIEGNIRRKWAESPDNNIGIDTGKSGLVVVDIDPASGGEDSLQSLEGEYDLLPTTVMVSTGGGGYHYYFKKPEGVEIKNSASKVAPGIDIRGQGGYVVAPPSVHESGRKYEWINPPGDYEPADLPEWLYRLVVEQKGKTEGESTSGQSEGSNILGQEDVIPEGRRNDSLFRIGCKLREYGMSEQEILPSLQGVNKTRCSPPLSEPELHLIVKGISQRYQKGDNLQKTVDRAKPGILDIVEDLDPSSSGAVEMVGGLCPRGYVSMIFSPPGTGKTWLTLKLITDLSSGGSILDGFTTSDPRNVLVFAGEAGSRMMNLRAKLTGWGYSRDRVKIISLSKAVTSDIEISLSNREGTHNIKEAIDLFSPDLVIFDSLSSFYEGEENSAKEMKPALRFLSEQADTRNIAILLNHHSRKKKEYSEEFILNQDDCVGSNVFSRYVAHMMAIDTRKDLDQKKRVVKTVKSWFPDIPEFSFLLEDNHMEIDLNPYFVDNKKARAYRVLTETFAPGQGFAKEKFINECKLRDISEHYSEKILRDWVKTGEVAKVGSTKGAYYKRP